MDIKDIDSDNLYEEIETEGSVIKMSEIVPRAKEAVFECDVCSAKTSVVQEFKNIKLEKPEECSGCGEPREEVDFNLVSEESTFENYQEGVLLGPDDHFLPLLLREDRVGETKVGERIKVKGTPEEMPVEKDGDDESAVTKMYFEVSELSQVKSAGEQEVPLSTEPGDEVLQDAIERVNEGEDILLVYQDEDDIPYQEFEDLKEGAELTEYIPPGSEQPAIKIERDKLLTHPLWFAEIGPYLCADGGVCIIPRLDQLSNESYMALSESMREGTVSVAKASINIQIPADVTVLAAAVSRNLEDIPHPIRNDFEIIEV